MIRGYRGIGPHHECTASGNILAIAGSDYDLDALQTDSQRTIDIMADDMFVANIIIPPAVYKPVTVDGEEKMALQPVEMGRVVVILWTKIVKETESDDNDHN